MWPAVDWLFCLKSRLSCCLRFIKQLLLRRRELARFIVDAVKWSLYLQDTGRHQTTGCICTCWICVYNNQIPPPTNRIPSLLKSLLRPCSHIQMYVRWCKVMVCKCRSRPNTHVKMWIKNVGICTHILKSQAENVQFTSDIILACSHSLHLCSMFWCFVSTRGIRRPREIFHHFCGDKTQLFFTESSTISICNHDY